MWFVSIGVRIKPLTKYWHQQRSCTMMFCHCDVSNPSGVSSVFRMWCITFYLIWYVSGNAPLQTQINPSGSRFHHWGFFFQYKTVGFQFGRMVMRHTPTKTNISAVSLFMSFIRLSCCLFNTGIVIPLMVRLVKFQFSFCIALWNTSLNVSAR